MKKPKFWSEGIQFQCQGSGNCCVSRGQYGRVYMTTEDRKLMAEHLGLGLTEFSKKYCSKKEGMWSLKDKTNGDCTFLKDKRCGVYKARPTQCRTWPFWPEVLNAKTWSKEVASFCPGVGKGKVWSPEEVETQRRIQLASDKLL